MSDLKSKNIVSKEEVNVKASLSRRGNLLAKAHSLPNTSGCYFMRSKQKQVIYVGKAKNLKTRVSSYFNNSTKSAKTIILVSHICDFDFILTQNEVESFVLENNLIKEHKPKYNIQLKDDKSYPYLSVNLNENFPRLEYVRRPRRKKNVELFGPFPVGSNISNILKILTKAFRLRDCSLHEFHARKVPCILYQMKQCSAPCTEEISSEHYLENIQQALNFFRSHRKMKKTLSSLTTSMLDCAEAEDFEQATFYRDYITQLDEFSQKTFDQSAENLDEANIDIISYFVGEEEIDISLYLIRRGNLLGHKNFHFLNADLLGDVEDEVMIAMLQYYSQVQDVLPDRIVTHFTEAHFKAFKEALVKIVGEGVKFNVQGVSKKYDSLISSTKKHAEETQKIRLKNQDSVYIGLNKLKTLLNLKERPISLECFDVAVWQGKSPTASKVVFYEGKPDKSKYRYFHLQELPEGNNDFAMMREVFSRRLKYKDLPDIFIVDGGVQQVNTVRKVLDEIQIDVRVIGIAKARDLKKAGFRSSEVSFSEERLIIQGRSNPYILSKCPSLMRIIVQMRDEAHRFSRKLHHKAEKKRVIHSWVEEIKGINQGVKKHILRVNTLAREELLEMTVKELQGFLGLETKHARALYKFLHAEEKI